MTTLQALGATPEVSAKRKSWSTSSSRSWQRRTAPTSSAKARALPRHASKITVGEARVRKRLQSLRPDKAAGPDSIPAFMLKTAADELTPMLMRIFKISLNLGQVPSDWKEANIVPMVNKRHCHQPASYRPVSLKPVLNWANVCSPNILRTGPRTVIRFLTELFSSPNMVRTVRRTLLRS